MSFNNVPVNGWPQIKDLEKLDAIASQIENMPTFTSDDKAFLEDLPAYPETDGTKILAATTYSGNTSLSYEDIPEELPADPESDGTRVLTATTSSGTTVKSWEAYQGMPNYSTTEQATGQKWIDGKDIYVKTFEFTSFASGINNLGAVASNVSEIVKFEGVFIKTISGASFNLPLSRYDNTTNYNQVYIGDNITCSIADGDFASSTYKLRLIVYYTITEV